MALTSLPRPTRNKPTRTKTSRLVGPPPHAKVAPEVSAIAAAVAAIGPARARATRFQVGQHLDAEERFRLAKKSIAIPPALAMDGKESGMFGGRGEWRTEPETGLTTIYWTSFAIADAKSQEFPWMMHQMTPERLAQTKEKFVARLDELAAIAARHDSAIGKLRRDAGLDAAQRRLIALNAEVDRLERVLLTTAPKTLADLQHQAKYCQRQSRHMGSRVKERDDVANFLTLAKTLAGMSQRGAFK